MSNKDEVLDIERIKREGITNQLKSVIKGKLNLIINVTNSIISYNILSNIENNENKILATKKIEEIENSLSDVKELLTELNKYE